MAELPFELWTKIASYIPEYQMLSLCGVNRPFFEYAMKSRYRDVHLGGIHDEEYYVALSSWLMSTRHPVVSRRVQSISVDTLNFKTYLLLEPTKFWAEKSTPSHLSPSHANPRFHGLRSLSISIASIYRYGQFIRERRLVRSVHNLWQSIALSPITSLSLNLPIEAYRDGLIPSTLIIPSLQNLELHIWAGYATTDYRIYLTSKMAPFVNRHKEFLEQLTVICEENFFKVVPYYYCPSYFFEALDFLPKLRTVDIWAPLLNPSQTNLSGLQRFLESHSSHLTSLTLGLFYSVQHNTFETRPSILPYTEQQLAATPLFMPSSSIRFSNLRKLDFSAFEEQVGSFPLEMFIAWARRHPTWAKSLESLSLSRNILLPNEALKLVSAVRFSALTDVSLYVLYLNASFLKRLEAALPQLEQLALYIGCFESDNSNSMDFSLVEIITENKINEELKAHVFVNWNLRRLTIDVEDGIHQLASERRQILSRIFPNVVKFEWKFRGHPLDKLPVLGVSNPC